MTHTEERTGVPPLSEAERVFCNFVRQGPEIDNDRFEELCAEHPELEGDLRQLLFNWRKVSAILGNLDREPEFAERLRRKYGAQIDPGISLDHSTTNTLRQSLAGETSLASKFGGDRSPVRRYVYREEVARGGMGAILRIWDKDLRRTLAMKVMLGSGVDLPDANAPLDERMLSRFLEEAQITGQLDHPGIVPVHELGLDAEGRVYFTMRYVRGEDLKQILDRVAEGEGAEEWTQIRLLGVVQRICEAVAFAHSKGVVHRDLKPANVMVGRFGETYVMDWGLARVLGRAERPEHRVKSTAELSVSIVQTDRRDEKTQEPDSPLVTLDGDVVGTPSYMSPEQAMGRLEEVGPASDIYAVGSILYHLLTKRVPYTTDGARVSPHTVLSRLLEGPPTPIEELDRDVPSELAAICNKAMAREASDRYASMLELADDLRAFMEGRVVSAYETGAVAEFKKWVHRNRGMAGAIAALVIVALSALFTVLFVEVRARQDQERRNQELAALNADLAALNEEKQLLAESERESAREALQQRDLAEHNAELSRRRSYTAKILAADYSLPLNEVERAKTILASCDEEYRGWEWSNLALRSDASLATIPLYPDRPIRVAFSPDGTQLLVTNAHRFAAFYDVATLTELSRIEPQGTFVVEAQDTLHQVLDPQGRVAVGAVRFSGGTSFFNVNLTAGLAIWDLEQPSAPLSQEVRSPLASDPARELPSAIGVTADASQVVLAWGRTLQYWKRSPWTLERQYELEGRPEQVENRLLHRNVSHLTFTADGEHFLTSFWGGASGESNADFSIEMRRVDDGSLVRQMNGHDGQVTALVVSPTEAIAASASEDRTVRIWNLETGELEATLVGHDGPVRAVAFDGQGKRLLTGGDDNTARLWSARKGHPIATLVGHDDAVHSVAFSPDGSMVVTGSLDRAVKLWDPLISNAYTPLNLALTFPTGTVSTSSATFSPDASQVLTGDTNGTVWRWDSRSGVPSARIEAHESWITDIAYAADGKTFATCAGDKSVVIWDALTDQALHRIPMRRRRAEAVAFDPAGRRLAVADLDKQVHVFDVESGEALVQFEEHPHPLRSVAWSPDGERIVTSCRRKVLLWTADDPTDFREVPGVDVHPTTACFSPDGKTVAVGYDDGTARLWDAETLALSNELDSDESLVAQLTYNADGTRLAGGRSDGRVQFWDPVWGERLYQLNVHGSLLNALEFDPSGERLLTSTSRAFESGEPVRPPRIWETSSTAERRAAVRTAKSIADRVRPLIDKLYDEVYFLEDVRARLAVRSDLSDAERSTALRMAAFRGNRALDLDSWARIKLENDDPDLALRLATRAVELEPEVVPYTVTLSRALYHTDQPAEALERIEGTLEFLEERPLYDRTGENRGTCRAYRALCQIALDLPAAEESLEQVRSELEERGVPSNAILLAALEELDRVIGGGLLPDAPAGSDESPGD